jgi:TonB family protein
MTRPLFTFVFLLAITSLSASQVSAGIRVGETFMVEHLEKKVAPDYPTLARRARIQGPVVLRVKINKSGDVESMKLVSGHPMLAPSAMEALKQWKYKPYLLNGVPIDVWTDVTINFALSDKSPSEGTVGSVPGGVPEGEQGGIAQGIAPGVDAGSTHPAVPQRVRVSARVSQGLLLTKVAPHYPTDAREQHIEGTVLLKVNVDKTGSVDRVELISGHPLLAPSAIEAVKQWKYRPFLLIAAPVEVEMQVQINFSLRP